MTFAALLQRLATLQLAAALLLLAAAPAQAQQTVRAKLQVSAQVVISCRLDASVPRVGTAERRTGCDNACGSPRAESTVRNEQHVAETRADGTTVATVLF